MMHFLRSQLWDFPHNLITKWVGRVEKNREFLSTTSCVIPTQFGGSCRCCFCRSNCCCHHTVCLRRGHDDDDVGLSSFSCHCSSLSLSSRKEKRTHTYNHEKPGSLPRAVRVTALLMLLFLSPPLCVYLHCYQAVTSDPNPIPAAAPPPSDIALTQIITVVKCYERQRPTTQTRQRQRQLLLLAVVCVWRRVWGCV